jgi:galactokinase
MGSPPELVAKAPGRVNLIGEHTDYNGGFVLPAAIDYATYVAIAKRSDTRLNVVALDWNDETDTVDLSAPQEFNHTRMWPNYVRGVVEQLLKRGLPVGGCDLVISGNIPQGAGLSSSASLEVALGKAISELCGSSLSALDLARVGQDAENQFVGCACGIMDQLISASGAADHAVLIDCRDFTTTPVGLPDGYAIMIINSNVRRGLVDSEYNLRRLQCETAARHYGVALLREISTDQLHDGRGNLDLLSFNRARHVVEENDRVLQMVDALAAGNLQLVSGFMADSHESMKSLFEITVPAVDFLVDIVAEVLHGDGGVRMTGGGFGGCVIALVANDRLTAVADVVQEKYPQNTGLQADVYLASATQGVSLVDQPHVKR